MTHLKVTCKSHCTSNSQDNLCGLFLLVLNETRHLKVEAQMLQVTEVKTVLDN